MNVEGIYKALSELLGTTVEVKSQLLVDVNNNMILSDSEDLENSETLILQDDNIFEKVKENLTCCVGGKNLLYMDDVTVVGCLVKATNGLAISNIKKVLFHYGDEVEIVNI
jgi:hypothetical protein